MDSKTLTTIAVVAGVLILAMMVLKQNKPKVAAPAATKGTTTGSSVWSTLIGTAGTVATAIFGGNSGGGASSSGGGYSWGGYQDSDLSLGGGGGE